MKIVLRHDRQEQGIAIIVVMVSIFVLAALAADFATRMKVETRLAMSSNYDAEMECIARSGVEVARWYVADKLSHPNEHYDWLGDKWAGGPGGTNDPPGPELHGDLGHGHYDVTIKDTERKYNINMALNNDAILQQALLLTGADPSQSSTIIGSVEDWLDRDNETHQNGAETEYYQSLDTPYVAKNGPIDDISELLLIKGVTPDIYWGPAYSNHIYSVPQKIQAESIGPLAGAAAAPVGLVDIFTPISNGKINLNTASAAVLQMIPGIDQSMADQIIQMRTQNAIGANGAGYQELMQFGLSPAAAQAISQYCDVRCSTYEVVVDVRVGLVKRRYKALMRRNNPKDVQILYMHWD